MNWKAGFLSIFDILDPTSAELLLSDMVHKFANVEKEWVLIKSKSNTQIRPCLLSNAKSKNYINFTLHWLKMLITTPFGI